MQNCNTTLLDIAPAEKLEEVHQSIQKEQINRIKYLFQVADEEFGPTNWNHSVVSQVIDYVENQNGLYSAGVAAFVKVELRCGAYHQEIGYGISEGVPKKGEAISFAREDAAVNGLQKALLSFGGKLKHQILFMKFQEVNHQQKQTINLLQSTHKTDTPKLIKESEVKYESKKSDISNIVAENALNSEGRGDDVSPTSLKMQSLTEEERRAARKRRQQQKQEEFRQIYQQKRRSVPHEMIDWSKVEGFPGTDDEFLTTQEVENLADIHKPGMKNGMSPIILKQSASKILMDSSRSASPAAKRLALQPKAI